MKPLCFVLMPFGQKPDGAGATADFDAVYHTLIKPAVDAVGLESIRSDEELAGGIDRVRYSTEMKERLALARKQGVLAIEHKLGALNAQESGVLIDLFLSYRAVNAWKEMIALVEKMPTPLANTVMVQEQLAFALNHDKHGDRA